MNSAASWQQMRRWAAVVGGLGLVLVGLVSPVRAAAPLDPAITGYPNSIASTGDSITRAYNTGTIGFTDAPANSWATGTNGSVNSQYSRILAANPAINGHVFNDAVTGAKMSGLAGQVANVNAQQVDYVTILLGANDACTADEASMTPVATYRAQFQAALGALSAGSPNARVSVSSVPNIYNLWAILHDDSSARATWSLFSICQSMLVNPQSTAQADVDRRNRVRQRVVDYNTQLAEVCAQYVHCRFDNNAVFNTTFVPADVSTRDYFHPSITGQARLALGSYAATFDFTDNVAPTTKAVNVNPTLHGLTLAITAKDNVGVAGVEYKIDSGPYTRYTVPVAVPIGSVITYRAVDVNGNVEASHALTSTW
ncbi:MAG TPA: SGNH/GDSL hydrolase family protein [Chloroflexia bacterium]|nr:SGNH/GDSL hydrolase family protein [Chloroflexia bacterium]